MNMTFDIPSLMQAQSVAARCKDLKKAEELMISDREMDRIRKTTDKVVILQHRKQKLDQLDKKPDQRQPAQDQPLQTTEGIDETQPAREPPKPAPEGLDQRQPARGLPHPAREEILAQGGMPLHELSDTKKKASRSYTGRELRSFVANGMKNARELNRIPMPCSTICREIDEGLCCRSAYTRNFQKNPISGRVDTLWKPKRDKMGQFRTANQR